MLHPEKFVKLGIDPPKGVLCYGPPGARPADRPTSRHQAQQLCHLHCCLLIQMCSTRDAVCMLHILHLEPNCMRYELEVSQPRFASSAMSLSACVVSRRHVSLNI